MAAEHRLRLLVEMSRLAMIVGYSPESSLDVMDSMECASEVARLARERIYALQIQLERQNEKK